MQTDKRQLSLAVILLACIALFFWTQSRYPALDQKAQMGQRVSISAIAFDTVYKVDVAQPYAERAWRSSVNWGYTNWKGMTFGFLFASAFISLLRLLPNSPPSRNPWVNTLKGMFIGVPLGVCANCSTPIAYGMVSAGTRLETALATLFSSPTLNIYVLIMTFSLLPTQLAILKLVGVFVFVLAVMPMLARRMATNFGAGSSVDSVSTAKNASSISGIASLSDVTPSPAMPQANAVCQPPTKNWGQATAVFFRNYFVNLFFIVRTTLPLMLLAGILGACVMEALPATALANISVSLPTLAAVSLIATFLPVPMTFDVITTSVMLASGLPVGLGMALLFGLGIFSIYPALVIARRISVKLSIGLFFGVATIAMATGLIAQQLDQHKIASAEKTVGRLLDAEKTPTTQASDTGNSIEQTAATSAAASTPVSEERLNELVTNICSELIQPVWKENCQTGALLAIHSGDLTPSKPTSDPAVCETIKETAAQQKCLAEVARDFAIGSGDLKYCRVIPDSEIQASCHITILVNRTKTQYTLLQTEQNTVQPPSQAQTSAPSSEAGMPHDNAARINWEPVLRSEADTQTAAALNIQRSAYQTSPFAVEKPGTQFTQVSADSIGIQLPSDFRLADFYEPFKYGRGIASGDINNDGAADLVFATSKGPVVFINSGDGHFSRLPLGFPVAEPYNAFLVTFVDLDNDGWQDLFFSTYGGTNYWLTNDHGKLDATKLRKIANPNTSLTMAAGFADLNKNGYPDIMLGNWTAGAENQFATLYSRNVWWINNGGDFNVYDDDAVNGETLSVLMSDFNNNGRTDMVIANDGDAPDLYYFDKPDGGFERILPSQGIIPGTSLTTMSVDSADFNNDMHLDLFTTDMSFGPGEASSYCNLIDDPNGVSKCLGLLDGWKALKALTPQWCETQPKEDQKACVMAFVAAIARDTHSPATCDRITDEFADIRMLCRRMSENLPHTPLSLADHIPQKHSNKLLLSDGNGKFTDATDAMQVGKSFWSWNSKAADLDNDGWQDILVANGFGFGEQQNEIHSNVFFHNQQGKTFVRDEAKFGLKELLNTPTYTYVDIDGDGDLDIIATAIMATPRVYINQGHNTSISVALRDELGNRFCIGCKVTVNYGDHQHQLKELKLSGGFMSFDDPALIFGLSSDKQIDKLSIQWADGSTSEITQPLQVGFRYLITRASDKKAGH